MEKRVLVGRWLASDTQPLPIYDEASVSSARERVRQAGRQWNAPNELIENVALIASELTHNHLAHARQGYFIVRSIERQGIRGLEVVAADLGPGIEKPIVAASRGYSPGESLRAGLAAVFRIADEVELDSRVAEGACIVARKFESRVEKWSEVAILGRPYPGQAISGDDAVFIQTESGLLAAVCDGLGHGPEARQASNCAVDVVRASDQLGLDEIVMRVNVALARFRGCAMSIVRFNKAAREMECLAAGDVHVHLYSPQGAHYFTPVPLVLRGVEIPPRKLRVERTPVDAGSVLVMFTDGLMSRTSLKGRLDLLRQPPMALAQHLIETEARATDDALVLVARLKA